MKTTKHCFSVAGFRLHVHMPETWKLEMMLPSFLPFWDKGMETDVDLLDCEAFLVSASHPMEMSGTLIEETCNDMGYIRLFAQSDGYKVTLSRKPGGALHLMQANRDFSHIRITLCEKDNSPEVCCPPYCVLLIRKPCCIIRRYPSMLRRSIAKGKPIFLWERAGRAKVPIRLCG